MTRVVAALHCLVVSLYPCVVNAQSYSDLVGKWNNLSTGENIVFENNFDVQDSRLGQGRITTTVDYAANYVIIYQGNKQCWYYVTVIDSGNALNLAVRNPEQSEEVCLRGEFRKIFGNDRTTAPTINDVLTGISGGLVPLRMSWREFDKAFNEDHRTFKMGCEFFHENPYTLCSRLNACYFFHCEPATQEKVMVHRDIEFFSDLTVYEAFYDARVFESLQQKCSDLGSSFFSIVSGLGMTAEETYHLDGGRRLQAQNYKAVNKELEVYFERTYSASLFRNAEIWTCVDSLRYRIPVSSASTP